MKKLAASEKCTALPPSMRSRSPKGVFTASKAIDPTTTRLIGGGRVSALRPGAPPAGDALTEGKLARGPMRAIQIDEFGGPEVMHLTELDVPEPAEDEVLIRVSRAGVNFADTHARENVYLAKYELPLVPGGEVAGVVERAAGDLEQGQRVVAMTGTGAYAEYATASAATTFPLPEEVADDQALALLIQGLTAWHLFRTSAKLAHGESVVVHSAAGGVGSLAVQLAKPFGARRVIATASSEEKRALAMRLGADAALDGGVEDLTEALIEANGGDPVDIVLEMAGGRVFDQSLAALAPFGRLVTYGIASREPNEVSTGRLLRKSQAVIGFWLMHGIERPETMLREPLADLFERAARGEVEAIGGRHLPALGGTPRARGHPVAPHKRQARAGPRWIASQRTCRHSQNWGSPSRSSRLSSISATSSPLRSRNRRSPSSSRGAT